jgi:uncharacterized protein DUF4190
MTTPERPGDWPYGGAQQPAAGQQPYVEPPIAGMPYNAQPPSGEVPVAGFQYNPQATPPPQQSYYSPAPQQQYQPQYQPGPYQQPYGYNPYPRPTSTNGLAIASMVLGILWVYWIGSILALVFGYVARDQIKRSGQQGDGMAIAGIVLGWVGIGFLILGLTVWSSVWF